MLMSYFLSYHHPPLTPKGGVLNAFDLQLIIKTKMCSPLGVGGRRKEKRAA